MSTSTTLTTIPEISKHCAPTATPFFTERGRSSRGAGGVDGASSASAPYSMSTLTKRRRVPPSLKR